MPIVNREELRRYLENHAKRPERIPEVMELLEPFFRNAEQRTYPLANVGELDATEVARIIAMSVQGCREIKQIGFISRERQLIEPKSTIKDACEVKPRDSLEFLVSLLQRSIETGQWGELRVALVEDMKEAVGSGISDTLMCFLNRALDDGDNYEQLIPYIRLLLKAIPLGEKKDEPGTWLVLVA